MKNLFILFVLTSLTGCMSNHVPSLCKKMQQPVVERNPIEVTKCMARYKDWLRYKLGKLHYERNLEWSQKKEHILFEFTISPEGDVKIGNVLSHSFKDEIIVQDVLQYMNGFKFPKGVAKEFSGKMNLVFNSDTY